MKTTKVSVRGEVWRLSFCRMAPDNYGLCNHSDKRISINKTLGIADTLSTVIHEYIHAALPDLHEQCVEELCMDLSSILIECGLIREEGGE